MLENIPGYRFVHLKVCLGVCPTLCTFLLLKSIQEIYILQIAYNFLRHKAKYFQHEYRRPGSLIYLCNQLGRITASRMNFVSLLFDLKFAFIRCSRNLLHFVKNKKLLPKVYCFKMLIMQNIFFRIKKKLLSMKQHM